MNEEIIEKLKDAGLTHVPKHESGYRMIGQLNPVVKRKLTYNQDYKENVDNIINHVNQRPLISDLSPYGNQIRGDQGQSIMRLFSTPNNYEGQRQIRNFINFNKESQFFAYDIETLGGAMERDRYSISEIAIQGFEKEGQRIRPTSNSFIELIAPTQEVVADVQKTIETLKADPYLFNSLTDTQKRTFVDLTRYSSQGSSPAEFNIVEGNLLGVEHNTFINQMFQDEELIPSRVVNKISEVINHAESGLENISTSKFGTEASQAIINYNSFVEKHKGNYFASYNGEFFDLPVLESWGNQVGAGINATIPDKHIDYFKVIQTVYPTPHKLHEKLGRNLSEQPFKMGATKLQEFRNTLGFDTDAAHNAMHDIGMEGLGGVIDQSQDLIMKDVLEARTNIKDGFNYHQSEFSWSSEYLERGQTLFAIGGARAKQDGDSSFSARYNQSTKQFEPITNDFNMNIINSKSFYQVEDLVDMTEGDVPRLALRLKNMDDETYSFIVREGESAFDQIGEFVQSRFYNWDGLDPKQQQEIRKAKLADSARRRYQNLFSLDGAGTGTTRGFEAAKRMYQNAEIFEERIQGKHKNIRDGNYEELMNQRITHEELMSKLKGRFNSLWDPNTRKFVHNQTEQEEFFRMGERLISERPLYQKALKHIEEEIEDPRQRDLAWNLYNQKVKDHLSNQGYEFPVENIELGEFENRRVQLLDYTDNVTHNLNMTSHQTTEQSIKNFVYARSISQSSLDRDLKQDRYRERLVRFVGNLRTNDVIPKETQQELSSIIRGSDNVHNSILNIASILQETEVKFDENIERISLGFNNIQEHLSEDINELIYREVTKDTQNLSKLKFNPNQVSGSRVSFDGGIESTLKHLDENQLSGLTPNNRSALEHVVANLVENDRFKKYHYAVSLDESSANARITVYDPSQSASVVEHLARGEQHPNALNIEMPLINQSGMHVIGGRKLNARTFLEYDYDSPKNNRIIQKSSSEIIADDYSRRMKYILEALDEGDASLANLRAKRTLNNSVEKLSGRQKGYDFNDSYYSRTKGSELPAFSDFLKQGQVDAESAMIHDWFNKGMLTDQDFHSTPFYQGRLKRDVSFNDLHQRKSYEMLLAAGEWIEDKGLDLFVGSNKADHISDGIFNRLNIREYLPYGHYTFQGRDNSVQYQNYFELSSDLKKNIMDGVTDTNAYVNFGDLITTDAKLAWDNEWSDRHLNSSMGMNIKTAYMNDEQLLARITDLAETEEGLKLLKDERIINPDNSWNHVNIPRIYENQGLIARDIQDNMNITDYKLLSKGQDFTLNEGFQEKGAIVKPGQTIGYENIEGYERPIIYQGKHDAQIMYEDGRVGVDWQEKGFKHVFEGEKTTDVGISRKLLTEITGDSSVSAIINADIQKHRDFSMYLSGKAKLLAEEMQGVSQDLSILQSETHPNDKASTKALQRIELENRQAEISNLASSVNLEWDQNQNVFFQRGQADIPANRFNEIFEELGIQDKTKHGFELSILEDRIAKVNNYSKMVDETGGKVLAVNHDEKGNLVKTYFRNEHGEVQLDGVKLGHREMGIFKDLGLTQTYNKVFGIMMEQSKDSGRLQESKNIIASITAATDQSHELLENAPSLNVSDFRSLPEIDRERDSYLKTVFDQEHVKGFLTSQENVNTHGYWLNLPTVVEPSGNERKVTANVDGGRSGRVQQDKIFVPFTDMEGAGGKIFNRELQQKISNIYRRADEVERSEGLEARGQAMDRLQESVDDYYDQAVKDVTASKGQTGEGVLRAHMPNSGTGLFKLLDPAVSMDLDGEFTFISEDDARAKGIYDQLKDIQDKRNAGEVVDDLYTINERHPAFHSNAIQIAKVRMSPDVPSGEFLTTSFISDLMKADSDGDYDNIITIDDPSVQKELKARYDIQQGLSEQAYTDQLQKASRSGRSFDPNFVLNGAESFQAFTPNTQEEIAAKMGKRAIGVASNLNLSMRQLADEYLDHSSVERNAIHQFGQTLEQTPISSKHGLVVEEGRAPAIELSQSIYNRDWNKVREIQQTYFDGDFDLEVMENAFKGLDEAAENLKQGLRSPSLRFGTGHGVSADIGLQQITDIIHGNADPSEYVTSNSHLNLLQQAYEIDGSKEYVDLEGEVHRRIDPYDTARPDPRDTRTKGLRGLIEESAEDLTGGSSRVKRVTQNILDHLSENTASRWAAIGSAAALAGTASYNMLKDTEPITEYDLGDNPYYQINYPQTQSSSGQPSINYQEPQSALDMNASTFNSVQNADIQVRASGARQSEEQMSHMINEGMNRSNMNTGNSRVSINYTDNTQNLNNIWYRDVVQDNI